MKRLVFVALVCVAMCALRAGVVVDAQTDVPRRICTNEVTFAWDWNWDWVPANAQSATVVVESQEGNVFSNTVARPATSMTWRVFNTTSRIVDATYNVTLSFPCVGNLAASRTVSYELRTDSFASHVRACETNSAVWRKFTLPAAFPFNACWFRGASTITYIQWKNQDDPTMPVIEPPDGSESVLNKAQGFLAVPNGYLPKARYLASIYQGNIRLAQCEISNIRGMIIDFR